MAFAEALTGFCPPARDGAKQSVTTAGLFVSGSDKAVPLRIRSVNSKVFCDTSFADTTETFAFIADEDVSVVFKFPLPPRAAVYKLDAVVGDRTITTEVKARQEAQQEFDQAVQQGHTAVIAKQEDSEQIFTLELGNLAAMEEALVHVSYLRVLDNVGGALEFVHTSTWTPPYLGSKGDQQRGAEHAAENNPRFAPKVHYTLSYDVELLSSRGFKAVESPEPISVKDEHEGKAGVPATKRVTLSEQVADPSKDLTVLVELQPLDSGAHAAWSADGFADASLMECERPAEGGGGEEKKQKKKLVALASFVPRALQSARADDGAPAEPLNLELVLIVDCSGSMMGPRIDQARESALYFIKDLPSNRAIKFDVVCFGSTVVSWSGAEGCREFDDANMKSAVEWVQQNVHANLGGTEILETFKHVYKMPVTPGYTRQVIFMTDGGISGSEEEAVFKLVQGGKVDGGGGADGDAHGGHSLGANLMAGIQKLKARVLGSALHAPPAGGEAGSSAAGADAADKPPAAPPAPAPSAPPAVHCLGIGYGVHRGLLDGIARRTGAVAQYVVDGESIARKTAFLKKAALSGRSAIYVPKLAPAPGVLRAVPAALPPRLFPDEAVHLLVELDAAAPPGKLELQGKRGDGSRWALAVPLAGAQTTQGDAYAVLHAMVFVSGLLDGSSHLHLKEEDGAPLDPQPTPEQVQAEVTRAAVAERLVTRHTAAVGVLLQKDPLDPAKVKKVEVPLATPHGALLFQPPDATPMMRFGAAAGGGGVAYAAMPRAMPMMARMMVASAAPGGAPRRKLAAAPGPAPSGVYSIAEDGARPLRGGGGGGAPHQELLKTPAPERLHPKGGRPQVADAGPVAVLGPDGLPVPGVLAGPAGAATSFQAFVSDSVGAPQLLADDVSGVAAPDEEGGAGAPAPSAAPAAAGPRTAKEVLDMLNLKRGLEGSWADSDEVLRAVTLLAAGGEVAAEAERAAAAAAARAARPEALSAEQWATVLALAFLRKRCAAERSTWEGMEAKAMTWLSAGWPAGAKSVGVTVLTASKWV